MRLGRVQAQLWQNPGHIFRLGSEGSVDRSLQEPFGRVAFIMRWLDAVGGVVATQGRCTRGAIRLMVGWTDQPLNTKYLPVFHYRVLRGPDPS